MRVKLSREDWMDDKDLKDRALQTEEAAYTKTHGGAVSSEPLGPQDGTWPIGSLSEGPEH